MFLKGQQVGKYQILETLGVGGFGAVYLAIDSWLDKKVALKVPHKQSDDLFQLLKESRLHAALNHPNIVRLVTAEKAEEVFFMVMEYVKGESLESILDREKTLDVKRATDYLRQACLGLMHAHQNHVLHRDLRPSNLLVSDAGQIKITDFGTSTIIESKAYAQTRIGSPPYMAPEQFQGKAVLASDIYSLGCIFYEMISGAPPLFHPNPAIMEKLATQGKITPLKIKNPAVPRALNDVCMKALATDVKERYQSVADILGDMDAALGVTRKESQMEDIRSRLKAREEASRARRCWNCHRPLPPRAQRCNYCNEVQK
ncbi:MAG: serine/threonine-protein kinase [Acidobacteriota bacterium]